MTELRPWCECDPEFEGRCPVPCALETIGRGDPALIPQATPGVTRSDPEASGAHDDESPASDGSSR